jgi:hypothetical protein
LFHVKHFPAVRCWDRWSAANALAGLCEALLGEALLGEALLGEALLGWLGSRDGPYGSA